MQLVHRVNQNMTAQLVDIPQYYIRMTAVVWSRWLCESEGRCLELNTIMVAGANALPRVMLGVCIVVNCSSEGQLGIAVAL